MNGSLVFDLATGLAPAERARATRHKPSVRPPFSKAAKCCIAKRTFCSMSWPRPSPMARARSTWSRCARFRCSSLMTLACASCRTRPPRIRWKSSCDARSAAASRSRAQVRPAQLAYQGRCCILRKKLLSAEIISDDTTPTTPPPGIEPSCTPEIRITKRHARERAGTLRSQLIQLSGCHSAAKQGGRRR